MVPEIFKRLKQEVKQDFLFLYFLASTLDF
jgi:hypothetical protein